MKTKQYCIDRKTPGGWINSRIIVECSRSSRALQYGAQRFPEEKLRARLIRGEFDRRYYQFIQL